MLAVPDVDEVRSAAVERSATADGEPQEGRGHRNAWIVDPFGHRWGLNPPL